MECKETQALMQNVFRIYARTIARENEYKLYFNSECVWSWGIYWANVMNYAKLWLNHNDLIKKINLFRTVIGIQIITIYQIMLFYQFTYSVTRTYTGAAVIGHLLYICFTILEWVYHLQLDNLHQSVLLERPWKHIFLAVCSCNIFLTIPSLNW